MLRPVLVLVTLSAFGVSAFECVQTLREQSPRDLDPLTYRPAVPGMAEYVAFQTKLQGPVLGDKCPQEIPKIAARLASTPVGGPRFFVGYVRGSSPRGATFMSDATPARYTGLLRAAPACLTLQAGLSPDQSYLLAVDAPPPSALVSILVALVFAGSLALALLGGRPRAARMAPNAAASPLLLEIGPSPLRGWSFVAVFLVAAGLALLSGWLRVALVFIAFGPFVGTAAVWSALAASGQRLRLFADRFESLRPIHGGLLTLPWSEVEWILFERGRGKVGTGSFAVGRGEKSLVRVPLFGSARSRVAATLGDIARKRFLPEARARLRRGEVVSFGPLTLSLDEIRYQAAFGRWRTLPRSGFSTVREKRGRLVFERGRRLLPNDVLSISALRNPWVALDLLHELAGTPRPRS